MYFKSKAQVLLGLAVGFASVGLFNYVVASKASENNNSRRGNPFLPIRTYTYDASGIHVSFYEDIDDDNSRSLEHLKLVNPEAAAAVQEILSADKAISPLRMCLIELSKRIEPNPIPKHGQRHDFGITVAIDSKDGVGIVKSAVLSQGQVWPPHFDVKAIECYLQAYQGLRVSTDVDFEYEMEWPMCVTAKTSSELISEYQAYELEQAEKQ